MNLEITRKGNQINKELIATWSMEFLFFLNIFFCKSHLIDPHSSNYLLNKQIIAKLYKIQKLVMIYNYVVISLR